MIGFTQIMDLIELLIFIGDVTEYGVSFEYSGSIDTDNLLLIAIYGPDIGKTYKVELDKLDQDSYNDIYNDIRELLDGDISI